MAKTEKDLIMDLSATLLITQRGFDEIKDRKFKLDIKARTILLVLMHGQKSLGELLAKISLDKNIIFDTIEFLVKGGFIDLGGESSSTQTVSDARSTNRSHPAASIASTFYLKEGIVLSEARFLLTNFCVDAFGMQSEVLVNTVSEANTIYKMQECLKAIFEITVQKAPSEITVLQNVVQEINATSD